jgi:hypothetical protein
MAPNPVQGIRAEREPTIGLEQINRTHQTDEADLDQILEVDAAASPAACMLVNEGRVVDDDRGDAGADADGASTAAGPGEGRE